MNDLESFGSTLQLQAAATVPAGGANSINADIQNGPTDQNTIWIVEYASWFYFDLDLGGTDIKYDTISVVPVTQHAVADPALADGGVDFDNRGILLPTDGDVGSAIPGINVYRTLLERGYVIPYGSTLRATKSAVLESAGPGIPLTENSQLVFRVMVRSVQICCK